MSSDLNASTAPFYEYREGIESRWATPENPRGRKASGGRLSRGRKGSACFYLKAGQTIVLAHEIDTSGIIRRIWMTLSDQTPRMLRSLRLDFFWDDASKPAVSVPFGDFFGIGLGRVTAFQSAFFSSPEGRSFNCFIPMPFRKGMKLTVTNEGDEALYFLYYEIDYTLGDRLDDKVMYFHACFRSETPTTLMKDYEILPEVRGRGRYLGANIGVASDTVNYFNTWWGEGECKIFLDDDNEFPTLCGTGTEDYIGTGWELGAYSHMYQGCPVADMEKLRFSFYRYHVPDPIYFGSRIRVTMQQIGSRTPYVRDLFYKAGRPVYHAGAFVEKPFTEVDFSESSRETLFGLIERQDNWSSCSYFYLDSCINSLPELEPPDKRLAALPDYDEKELNAVKIVPQEILALKKYIPDIDKLEKEDLALIIRNCNIILKSVENQEAAFADHPDAK